MAVVALHQALIVHLERQEASGWNSSILHRRIVKENKWRAARWSTAGATIVNEQGRLEPIAASTEKLIARLQPLFEELGSAGELVTLADMLARGPSFARQRAVYRETGELKCVVDALIEESEAGRPVTWCRAGGREFQGRAAREAGR